MGLDGQFGVGAADVVGGEGGEVGGGCRLTQAHYADVTAGAGALEQGAGKPAVAEVIDPAGPFVMQGDSTTRAQENMRMLVHSLEQIVNSTNLLTSYALAEASGAAGGVEEYLVEGVLALAISRSHERIVRTLAIRKMRGTAIDLTEYPFTIKKPKGIVLSPLL